MTTGFEVVWSAAAEVGVGQDVAGSAPGPAHDVVANQHRAGVAAEPEFTAVQTRPAKQRAADGQAGELAVCLNVAGTAPGPAADVVADLHRAGVATE